ncbi:MAG: SPFH domain-containing protein [Candidatus Taylorbacteria bacterium]|nr:SPFH domain-containing protein [Candidatus Taylorbacteria bacterium]
MRKVHLILSLLFLTIARPLFAQDGGIAQGADSLWAMVATPLIILMVVAVLGLLGRALLKRYVKVPPEKALIVYGGGKTRVVSGGARLVIPVLEDFYFLDLRAFQFDVHLMNVPNKDSVPVNIKASVTCKISNKDDLLPIAAGVFGQEKMEEIINKVKAVIEGHVRLLIGQSTMEMILRERDQFNAKIQSEVTGELGKLGCEIVVLNIQEVTDPHGYIEALGKPKTAEVKAEAAIKEAEQLRRQTIQTTDAQRESAKIAAGNQAQIADAERDLQTKKADYDAEVARKRATADQAGPLASAEARKAVVAAEVEVEKSKVTAEIALQDAVQKKTKAELEATVLVRADAEKQRVVTEAQGKATARTTQAEAERTALEAEGDGQAKKTRLAGFAQAEVEKAKGEAEAAAEKAKLLANAEGTKAQLLAHAEGTQAELLAQAKGMKELVAAYADMSPDQQKLVVMKLVLERLPEVTKALGEAGEKVMGQIAQAVVASLGQIDNLTVYDSSSNGHDGALRRVMKVAPDAMFETLNQLKATGVLPALAGVAKNLGFDLSSFLPPAENGSSAVALPETVDAEEPRATSRSRATKSESDVRPSVSA